jgi:hypothetical protein
MGRLFLTFIIYMQASIMDILKSSNNMSAAVFDPSTMGRLFLAFIIYYNLIFTIKCIDSSILITIISCDYLNLSLANEYVGDVTILTHKI